MGKKISAEKSMPTAKTKVEVTAKNYRTLPPGRYSLGGGLTLLVSHAERRSWVFRYSLDGRRSDFSIGSANKLSITIAKQKAKELTAMVAAGRDPRFERNVKKAQDAVAAITFKGFYKKAIDSIEFTRKWRNAKHAAQWRSTIETYALPVLGTLPVEKITMEDVLAVLKPIWQEKPETAGRLRSRLEAVFSLAIVQKIIKENPAKWDDGLAFFLPPQAKVHKIKHHESMPFSETPAFCARLAASKKVSSLAILFGILTAARVSELLNVTWSEIDFETKTWTVPADRMKNGYEHRVPLSEQALQILQYQLSLRDRLSNREDLIFFSTIRRGRLSIDSPRRMIQKFTGKTYTMHGFRSTFRDWCEENFIHPSVAERALSHAPKDKVVAAYQRSDLLEQRRPVMQQWADAVLPNLGWVC